MAEAVMGRLRGVSQAGGARDFTAPHVVHIGIR
jgi:hypothetical protein